VGKKAARVGDLHLCPQVTIVVPHVGGPIVPAAPVKVMTEFKPAARLGDFAFCVGPQDVLIQGAATVLVNGLPFCGMTDQTVHGGSVILGAATVEVGGPTFKPPPNFVIKGGSAFQNKLIRDLFLLSTTPSGKALIARLEAAGKTVEFVPESDPHNSFCSADNNADARAGRPTGSVVSYNPDVALQAYDSSNNLIDMPPQVVLGHEMVHALDNSEGHHSYGTDPAPPATQPNIEEEEARAIGTGSHSGDSPTENTMRNDLGLARRDNHYGANTPAPTGNLRPGGY
jgi:uncharacterized Zn-binding protein involved in type VI secretion